MGILKNTSVLEIKLKDPTPSAKSWRGYKLINLVNKIVTEPDEEENGGYITSMVFWRTHQALKLKLKAPIPMLDSRCGPVVVTHLGQDNQYT